VACFRLSKGCASVAAVEKQGKTLCRVCAATLKGQEFPLRPPTRTPLYSSASELCRDLGIRRTGRPESRPANLWISMIEAH
jgi:hypothetical protein